METIQQQIGALKTSVKRQRLLNIALLGVIIAGGSVAATVAATAPRKWVQVSMSAIDTSAPFTGNDKLAAIDDEGTIWVFWKDEWKALPKIPVSKKP